MPAPPAEFPIDAALVHALLEEQHPDLARMTLREVAVGWDNVIFRLGDDLMVRLPRRLMSSLLVLNELRWLPDLAADLPLAVPVPLRAGMPGCGYPWPWFVAPWLPGIEAELEPPTDAEDAVRRLGAFVVALHQPAPPDAPRNPYRGVPLAQRTEGLLAGVDVLDDPSERGDVLELWDSLVATLPWPGPALWLHGDLHPRNLLVHEGRLSGVVDFGDVTAGDPATDLSVAWMLFSPAERAIFRQAAGQPDDATWARARAWALTLSVAYLGGDERIAGIGRRTLDAVLADT